MRILEALTKAGADVNLAATGGVTPLHIAAEQGLAEMLPLLLEACPTLWDSTLAWNNPLSSVSYILLHQCA